MDSGALIDSYSLSSPLADPGAIAGLAVGLACALALITALIVFCCFKASRRKNMKNLEEAPQHEMATHATGNHQGGAESWEINYVPFSGEVLGNRRKGKDDVETNVPPNTAEDGLEKWQSSYVPFSPPASFPCRTIEDENSLKGSASDDFLGDKGEVDLKETGTGVCPPSVLEREKPSLKQRVRGLQEARHANTLIGHLVSQHQQVMATESSVANLTWDSSHEPLETRESSLCLVHTPKPKCMPTPFNSPDSSPESPLISGSKTSLTWDDRGHSSSPV